MLIVYGKHRKERANHLKKELRWMPYLQFAAVAMYSPQSQKLIVGSTVSV
jgi:hypothetical protein